jgi:hypothetical protein
VGFAVHSYGWPWEPTIFMTLKIDRARARIRLSGEFRSEHLAQVESELELCGSPAVLDLEEVDLLDVEAVRFLNVCEANGISLVHCSPYIKKWMLRERNRPEVQTQNGYSRGGTRIVRSASGGKE